MDWIRFVGLGELMAISSALIFALGQGCIRQGMRTASPFLSALIINVMVSLGGIAVSLYRGTLQDATLIPLLWFVAMGIAGPGIGRISHLIGITKMGLNRSVTISSATPIWATLIAIVVLGETPGLSVLIGTVFIVSGVWLLSIREDESQSFRAWFRGALIFPLIASVAYAVAPIFVKLAFAYQKTPGVALAVGFAAGNVLLIAGKPLLPKWKVEQPLRRDVLWLITAGGINIMTAFLLTTAFVLAPISTTLPLSRTAPIWVLLVSYLFLGQLERITWRTVVAAVMVVMGGVLITAFRT
ncbi:MAG: DMT family transporter [Nitrospinaceae bacterium]|nr:DMT family transporter [Nitrospinaceae bacterium]MBT3821890.1 DMT family transporter [Nitrospinaceae bacterium]MBT4095211.1 DMT family transporter [Nitrospinaceae bacterium]MBT4430236.1 DMT family transporter [Nitrospinaceae bacterium]MBT5367870.1 DMT family transporter [Nitrospinaceae bacterium]